MKKENEVTVAELFYQGHNEKNLGILIIKKWAEIMPAQISFTWLMAQKPWIVAISGTTPIADMLENVGAADVQFTRLYLHPK